ncbi:GNAT family N-acetyltransferase [Mangrovihabitans endophyticus]|uniref:GNAT family N-acetyltransferase n=1 Tax=Mangrovihabitans endophyticus TaxID=1751298 RepID=UPI0016673079|nr:GNAT family N-acetyltransferase [Mangrovihabitans endophyticus]
MISVRRAGSADADQLMSLRAVMLADLGRTTSGDRDWRRAGIALARELLGRGDVAAYVVDRPDGDGLAACVTGQIDQRLPGPRDPAGLRGYVYNVATLPAYRRRGYSRACMSALLAWFAARDVGVVDLRASAAGEPLYASLGFRRTADPAMRLHLPPA